MITGLKTSAEAEDNPSVRRVADWSSVRLRELATEHGTPLYVIDVDRVRENAARLQRAFPNAAIDYAVKANARTPVLEALTDMGFGAECASAGEVVRACEAEFSRVRYTAVNPPGCDLDRAIDLAADHGLTITVGARDTLVRLADRGWTGRIYLRVHPDVGAGHHTKVKRVSEIGTGPAAADFDLDEVSMSVRYADVFERGANVTLASPRRDDHASIGQGEDNEHEAFISKFDQRTYERGIEGETRSCGIGAVAVAAVARKLELLADEPVSVHPPGGQLTIQFSNRSAVLTGPTEREFVDRVSVGQSRTVEIDREHELAADD